MPTDPRSQTLAKAVTVLTDPDTGKIIRTIAVLRNGVKVIVDGPLDLKVSE